MWTANIKSVESDQQANVARVTIEYTDGKETQVITERVSEPSTVKRIIQDKINSLEQKDRVAEYIANPTLGPVTFEKPQPSQEDLDKQKFILEYDKLCKMKKAIEISLMKDTDQAFVDQTALVKTLFKPEYVTLINGI